MSLNSNPTVPADARDVILQELKSVLPEGPVPFNILFYKTNPHKSRPLIYREPPKSKKHKVATHTTETNNDDKNEQKDSTGTRGTKNSKKPKNLKDYKKLKADKKRNTSVSHDFDYVTNYFILLTYQGLIIYAIEIVSYDVPGGAQTVFISKADTTGHYGLVPEVPNGQQCDTDKLSTLLPKISYAKVTEGILRSIIRCFIDPLRPLRINLFARSEKHYLFPFSAEKPGRKHLLSGSELVRWWVKVLDNVCKSSGASTSSSASEPTETSNTDNQTHKPVIKNVIRARLQVPGSEPAFIRSYFPAKQRFANSTTSQSGQPDLDTSFLWKVGDIFWPNDNPNFPAVRCIPRFSDDPLTRYLEFLVSEKRSTTTTQNIFWMELQTRQEFRLSIVVGVMGVECIVDPNQSIYYSSKAMQELGDKKANEKEKNRDGKIVPNRPNQRLNLVNATPVDKKISEQGGSEFATVTKWYMDRVHEYVTTLDYEETKMNNVATLGLVEKDKKVIFEITGTLKPQEEATSGADRSGDPVSNASSSNTLQNATGGVNIISGLVKKKKKAVESSSNGDGQVNTLNTMLVRKKPKKK